MAKYLEKELLATLDEYRHKIFSLREEAYRLTGIDVLDNDTLSALSIYEIVSKYDKNYNINFARNGEDAKSLMKNVEQKIEMKASRIERMKRSGLYGLAGFQFHAMGDLEYYRYIFVTRDKATLKLIKIYDISTEENCLQVQAHLLAEREAWLARGRADQKKMKHDVIILPEALLKVLEGSTTKTVNGVEVVMA
jgi:hypothetical protein